MFEAHGLEPWLVNAKDVKHLPGRPKTDVLDSVWLCKVAERQMLDIFGVSGRAMMAALIAGQRDPKALARMARDSKNVGCVLSPPLTSTVVVAALLHRPSQPRRASSESEEHCRDDDHPPPGLHDSGEG